MILTRTEVVQHPNDLKTAGTVGTAAEFTDKASRCHVPKGVEWLPKEGKVGSPSNTYGARHKWQCLTALTQKTHDEVRGSSGLDRRAAPAR